MNTRETFTAKQVGERIKERRLELHASMEQLAQVLGVNKSTVQRMELRGIDPSKKYKLIAIADALNTTVEWLTGQSDEKEISVETRCRKTLDKQIDVFISDILNNISTEPHQELLTNILSQFINMFGIIAVNFGRTMKEIRKVEDDMGLRESLKKYALNAATVMEQVYRKEMEAPIEEFKLMADKLLGLYDINTNSISKLYQISFDARRKLEEEQNSEN